MFALCVVVGYHACDISRVSDQNGVSPLYIMLEIHHVGREPSNYVCCVCDDCFLCVMFVYCVCVCDICFAVCDICVL